MTEIRNSTKEPLKVNQNIVNIKPLKVGAKTKGHSKKGGSSFISPNIDLIKATQ